MNSYSLVPSHLLSDSQKDLACHLKNRSTESWKGSPPPHKTHTKGLLLVSFESYLLNMVVNIEVEILTPLSPGEYAIKVYQGINTWEGF